MEILLTLLIFAIIGLVLGIVLSLSSIFFYVKEDTTLTDLIKILPGYNCGACGYPGCSGFAKGLLEGEDLNKCKPGKKLYPEIEKYLKSVQK